MQCESRRQPGPALCTGVGTVESALQLLTAETPFLQKVHSRHASTLHGQTGSSAQKAGKDMVTDALLDNSSLNAAGGRAAAVGTGGVH